MKRIRQIPQDTLDRQSEASDPAGSAWVSANAGSGKTHVLAQRVVRLLLGGTDPSKILCLTYTRAAAANMSNRVFRDLSLWTALSDDELADGIAALEGRRPAPEKLRLARRLFSKALETPGGLKIQTIHAFCEAVLHQFPLEANIAAHFQLLDQQMEEAMFAEARRDMIGGLAQAGDAALAEAFAVVLDRGGEFGLDTLLTEIVAKRTRLRDFIDRLHAIDPPEAGYRTLFAEFGFGPQESAASVAEAVWPLPGFPPDIFAAFRRAAETAEAASIVRNILPAATAAFAEADPVRRLELLAEGFLTEKGAPYGNGAFAKRLLALMPDAQERYRLAADAIAGAADRLALYRMLEGTAAMVTIADRLIGRYERLKSGRGFLDFGDLITRTVRLLSREDAGAWVQYKLDRGIDHILLDEAQDTSPDQWEVVRRLAAEFFAGAGARDEVRRTMFAVGDEKQSIYSFQGADPTSFAASKTLFSRLVTAARRSFREVPLHMSFRSTADVLEAVDRVFDDPETRRGLSEFKTAHSAVRRDEPGYVELWPSLPTGADQEEDDWTKPVDHLAAPAVKLAERITSTIAGWIADGELIEGQGRRVTPGDVLVLVRKRDAFMNALSRALKRADIPVAGADRLRLAEHIAVKDLLALGRFLLLSEDDLSLAAVLKSPIFGLTEEDLFEIAARRPKTQPLEAALRLKAEGDERLARVRETLVRWRGEASFKAPFEFYSGVLQRDGVRGRMIARLGNAAGDMLDEFLSFCLAYEQPGLPGLEALIAALETSSPEIRREMDQTRGEVRIMTVHAAKGLEAPIVFLVDGGGAPVVPAHLPRLMPFSGESALRGVDGFLWNSGVAVKNQAMRRITDRLKDLADDEYRRLLYVGMTRAEDRLIVCGYHGKLKQHPRSWHALVERTLSAAPETSVIRRPEFDDAEVLRFRSTPWDGGGVPSQDAASEAEPSPIVLPAFGPTPSPEALPRPLTPSGAAAIIEPAADQAAGARSPVLASASDTSQAALRGRIVHKLLQVVPDMAVGEREAAARRYLTYAAAGWSEAEREAAWRSVDGILSDPAFAPIFAPGSRAEISLMGTIDVRGRQRVVSGQIDRLAVTGREVLIVDYKTNREAPDTAGHAQPAYVLQLALYAELLRPLYPGKPVRAALLYTEKPALVEIGEAALAAALARLTQA